MAISPRTLLLPCATGALAACPDEFDDLPLAGICEVQAGVVGPNGPEQRGRLPVN